MTINLFDAIPDGWEPATLESVCARVTSGGTPSRQRPEFYRGGTWPWVKTQELLDRWIDDTEEKITDDAVSNSSAKVLPANTVLLAMYGATVGQLGILKKPMTCNQACCALVVDSTKADYRFVYYLLLGARSRIRTQSTGAAQQNLSGTQIKQFRFAFPKPQAQKAIARVLGSIDDKVELNRRMSQTHEALAAAIFDAWFEAVPKSELRKRALSDLAVMDSTAVHPYKQPDQLFEHFSIPAFDDGRVPVHEFGISIKSNKYRVRPTAVLVSKLNPQTPRVWMPKVNSAHAVCSTEFMQFVPHDPEQRELLYMLMRSDNMQAEVLKRVTGSTGSRQRAQPSQISELEVLLPEPPRARHLSQLLRPYLLQIARLAEESLALSRLRDALLPPLLSGELKVPDGGGL
jgi:type I restriction enzyme S subunit